MLIDSSLRCVLVTFVVFSGLQNILVAGTGTRGKTDPNFSDECQRELGLCTLRASLPYVGVNSNDALARARATPLAKHCTDWGAAMVCNRRKLRSRLCQNVTSAGTKQIIKFIEAGDLVVNYACKENFQNFSRIYQCLLDRTVSTSVRDQCKDLKFNATDACEKLPHLIECAAEGVAARCGSEAGSVATELGPKLWKILIEATFDRKCSPTKRDDITQLLTRFFFRK